jgi:PHP family Zn ribbon phosphoesterase
MQQVAELGSREVASRLDDDGFVRSDNGRPPYKRLVALTEILSKALEVGVNTKRVRVAYDRLVSEVGNELAVLMDASVPDIAAISGERVAEGVARVRSPSSPATTAALAPSRCGRSGRCQRRCAPPLTARPAGASIVGRPP